jgi:hypothetical protein
MRETSVPCTPRVVDVDEAHQPGVLEALLQIEPRRSDPEHLDVRNLIGDAA